MIAFLLALTASAWEHDGHVWDAFPVAVCIDGQGLDPALVADAELAIDGWNTALADLGRDGFVLDCTAPQVVFELDSAGPVGITTDGVIDVDGCEYAVATEALFSLHGNVDFGTHDQILSGQCGAASNIRSIVAHELGHALGLGHACDEGEVCNDPDLLGAVMYWTSPPCDTLVEPQIDDIAGLEALYGTSQTCAPGMPPSNSAPERDLDGISPMDDDDRAKPGCGCATGGPSAAWPLALLLLLGRRRN